MEEEETLAATSACSGLVDMDIDSQIPSTSSGQSNINGLKVNANQNVKLMALNDTKAGMEGLDTNKINQIIQEASKGSKFYQHKKVVQEKLDKKVLELQTAALAFTPSQILRSEREIDGRASVLERKRDLSRTIVHLDMDAFFAAVEIRDNPALRDVPMAVGSSSMLSTSNYAARKFGVRAAMPGFIAIKLCPELIIVPVNFQKYEKASQEIYEVLVQFDPQTSMSLDEAHLDLTEYLVQQNCFLQENKMVTAEEVVNEIRKRVYEKTKLTASAGIAANGFLAKICSDINKPNNQFYLPPTVESVKAFVEKLPIRKVNGIGAVTEQMLNGLEIRSCGDVWKKRGLINLLFKPSTISFLLHVATGNGQSFMSREDTAFGAANDDDRKSLSCERTFADTSDVNELKNICLELCTNLQEDLQRKKLLCKAVCLKIKTTSFDVKTRVRTIADFTCDADILFATAWRIFQSFEKQFDNNERNLRLMGVRLSNFRALQHESDDQLAGFSKQKRIDVLFNKFNSKSHQNQMVEDKLPFKCQICSRKFLCLTQLETHNAISGCQQGYYVPKDSNYEYVKTPNASTSSRNSESVNYNASCSTGPNIILDVFPACQLPKTNKVIECPICLDRIALSNELDHTKQLALEIHFESCILGAFEECDIFMDTGHTQQQNATPIRLVQHGYVSKKYQNVSDLKDASKTRKRTKKTFD